MSMTWREYNEAANIRALQRMGIDARVLFAMQCATRLLPAYHNFYKVTGRGDPQMLEQIAARVWADLATPHVSGSDTTQMIELCSTLIPAEDESWDESTQPYAEDAAAALAYALRARVTGEAQEAAWAGRRAYEARVHYARALLEKSHDHVTDSEISHHPAVQNELERQRRDLDELGKHDVFPLGPDVLERLRLRAEHEGTLVFSGL